MKTFRKLKRTYVLFRYLILESITKTLVLSDEAKFGRIFGTANYRNQPNASTARALLILVRAKARDT